MNNFKYFLSNFLTLISTFQKKKKILLEEVIDFLTSEVEINLPHSYLR